MTEGQIRYQQIVENQRHNLAVERLGAEENRLKSKEVKIKEAQEARNVEIFPYQKSQAHWGVVGSIMSNLLGGAKFIDTSISATRNFFGLAGDVGKLASNAEGGYYQGSLFA